MAVGNGVAAELFDGMAHGVPQIEHLPLAHVPLVPLDEVPLDLHAPGYDAVHIPAIDSPGKGVKQLFVGQQTILDALGAAVGKIVVGEGVQSGGVADHQLRLAEHSGQVLALGQVDAGLAAHRAVDGRQKSGGQLHQGNFPQIGTGGKSRHIPDDSAAQGQHQVAFGQAVFRQELKHLGPDAQAFAVFAVGENEGAQGIPGVFQPGGHLGEIEPGHIVIGDDGRLAPGVHLGDQAPGLFQKASFDVDVILFGRINGYCFHLFPPLRMMSDSSFFSLASRSRSKSPSLSPVSSRLA